MAETVKCGADKTEQQERPRFRIVNRAQMMWRVVDVEALIGDDHPARAIWEFVGQLDLSSFCSEIRAVAGRAGQPALDPWLLVSLWLYAYSRGIGSAREVSRQCEYEPGLQWLCGLEPVNHHSLSDFRVEHARALEELFTQVLGVLSAEGIIPLERVMHDGTRIRAAASGNTFRSEATLEQHLRVAREHVRHMSSAGEVEACSAGQRAAQQRATTERQQRLERALAQMQQLKQERYKYSHQAPRISTTDPEARVMKRPGGGFEPSYNLQLSTDSAQGIVIGVEVNQSGADSPHLIKAIRRVQETFGKLPREIVADAAYTSAENIVALHGKVELIGPVQVASEARHSGARKKAGIAEEFSHNHFVFEPALRGYRCPEGKLLAYYKLNDTDASGKRYAYRAKASDCQSCSQKPWCCPKTQVRSLYRLEENPILTQFREAMGTPQRKEIYRQRSQVAEFPNAWIKEKLKLRQFHVRGLAKVRAEAIWAVLTYNIQQWIRLCWRRPATA
jgi:transposase